MILPALKPRSQLVPCRTIIYGLKIAGPWNPPFPANFCQILHPALTENRKLFSFNRSYTPSQWFINSPNLWFLKNFICFVWSSTWNDHLEHGMVRGSMETMIYIPNSITRCFNAQVHTSWLQRGRQVKLFGDSTVLCLTIFVKVSGISFGPYDFQICP